MLSGREQALFQKICDGRLARAGNARKPDGAGFLTFDARTRGLINVERLAMFMRVQADTSLYFD